MSFVFRICGYFLIIVVSTFFSQMLKLTKLRDVTRNDLFPSADMVISMSREFGVPLTAEDFGGEPDLLLLCVFKLFQVCTLLLYCCNRTDIVGDTLPLSCLFSDSFPV